MTYPKSKDKHVSQKVHHQIKEGYMRPAMIEGGEKQEVVKRKGGNRKEEGKHMTMPCSPTVVPSSSSPLTNHLRAAGRTLSQMRPKL